MNKYIHMLIKEQFNITDLDFSDSGEENVNIFNKEIISPQKIYNNILHGRNVSDDDISMLNLFTAQVTPKIKKDLKTVVDFYSQNYPNDSLNWIDVSHMTNMTRLFSKIAGTTKKSRYTGDISKWDVSNVKNMNYMFSFSHFNNDISDWDVSNVENMSGMFHNNMKFN